jgi:type II secretory pathway pseudopilin PulG
MDRPMRRSGFTLLELMVALTLSMIVVVLAHRVVSGVLDGVHRLQDAQAAMDREMNGLRALTEAFSSLDVGPETGGFAGRPERVEFATWERVPGGWLVPKRVSVQLSGDTLLLRSEAPVALRTAVTNVRFDYLLEPAANSVWVREWISPVSAPVAIRLRITKTTSIDTLLFIIGSRG